MKLRPCHDGRAQEDRQLHNAFNNYTILSHKEIGNTMSRLQITEFSCLSSVDISFSEINVLIGPQGSGKSVTTKLLNFFIDIFTDFHRAAEDGLSLSEYRSQLQKKFVQWFPASAWGSSRFNIFYSASDFDVRVLRRKINSRLSEDVTIKFSKWFEELYQFTLSTYQDARAKRDAIESTNDHIADRIFEFSWRVRSQVRARISKDLGENFHLNQTFIPAGRAFFTSIGRLVAGFEHPGSLDPVTLKFARIFAGWRDRSNIYLPKEIATAAFEKRRQHLMLSLFGGRIISRKDTEFIEMEDGRRVPFSSLSSGQQELIPIWYFLDNLMLNDEVEILREGGRTSQTGKDLIYIEEPEAHLFPSAQSALMEALVGAVISEKSRRSLIITTHSPYIMMKLNVFLKAGQISRQKKRNTELSDIVARDCWIRRDQISAWRIEEGVVKSIIDDSEGLIDANYLDSISDDMAAEFEKLLDLEASL